jgi:hypothetical protein
LQSFAYFYQPKTNHYPLRAMKYEIELLCADPSRERFNIYMTLAGFDLSGVQVCLESLADGAGEGDSRRGAGEPLTLSCGECERAEAFLSVVAHTLPRATQVVEGMDFPTQLIARADGRELWRREYMINPWGGLSLSEIMISC